MPEGPSIVILTEQAAHLCGMRITAADGNARLDTSRLLGQTIRALRSWGKHFLIEFDDFALRVQFLLFGSYRIDEDRVGVTPRLRLSGRKGELNLYACSLRYIDEPLDDVYDWSADIMSTRWDAAAARRKLAQRPTMLACDALLDQDVFAGVGNIIKNEVLFRVRVHPLSTLGAMPARKRADLVREARQYSSQFLEWKNAGTLKRQWLAHTKQICPRCGIPFLLGKLGRTKRRSFYCAECQRRYTATHNEP